jgi:cell division protein FtsB
MKNSRWQDPKFARSAILVLVLVCVGLVVHEIFGTNGYLALRRQKQQHQALEQQIQQLKQQNDHLQREIKALKTDPQAIEKLAREQMHLAKPGEIIYTLPNKTQKPQDASSSAQKEPSPPQ